MAKGMYFSEYEVGQEFVTGRRTVTKVDVVAFAGLSGDFNPLHTDKVFAESTPFGQRIAHGMLVTSISTGLSQTLGIFEGTTMGLLQQTFIYKAPTFFGDTIHLKMIVRETKSFPQKAEKALLLSMQKSSNKMELLSYRVNGASCSLTRDPSQTASSTTSFCRE